MKSQYSILAAMALTAFIMSCSGNETAETKSNEPNASETPTASATENEVATPTMEGGVQIVHVVVNDMGYTPNRIQFQPGVPARIVFEQQGKHECSSQVQSPDLGIAVTDVPQGKETAVEFTPEKEGEYTFMCGMDMLKGTIIVKQS